MESLALTMFNDLFRGKRVLITGHTGFKGSWLSLWLTKLGARVTGLSLAPETTPSHWDLLALPDVTDLRIDLRNAKAVATAVVNAQPEIVFHLAAQPLVRRSYRQPVETFDTNVMGLVHLLEAIRTTDSVRVFVNATTDKIYAEHDTAQGYAESAPLGGHDPYSTSKACAELVTESYRKSFLGQQVRMATARAGNVIGGGDWSEDRLVPDIVRACVSGNTLLIRNPQAIRPWQHVLEPLSGYLRLAETAWEEGLDSNAWNFGPRPDADLPVTRIVEAARLQWPRFDVAHDTDHHPHEAAVLRLDSRLAETKLGWRPVWTPETAIARTIQWYRAFHDDGTLGTARDLDAYTIEAKSQGAPWAE